MTSSYSFNLMIVLPFKCRTEQQRAHEAHEIKEADASSLEVRN
jgi:hypothetical protein